MSTEILYLRNKATGSEIEDHLLRCDALFVPPLSGRVQINGYARKIAEKAERFEAWCGNRLIALVAAYCNDSELRIAYITNVSVLAEWQGKGIASHLVDDCIHMVNELGFERLELEVGSENTHALQLYTKKRFDTKKVEGQLTTMSLILGAVRK